MWIITNFGFFSIVEKSEDKEVGTLTIRARVRSDLETLRDMYLPSLGEIVSSDNNDYRFRAQASREAVSVALLKATLNIDYDNFKTSVGKKQGGAREDVYHDVWHALYKLQKSVPARRKAAERVEIATLIEPGTSYGGVLINEQGQVLLVEPAGHFDGTVWTWPKGKPAAKETNAESVALREVLEETGYNAEIVAAIKGSWKGTTGQTQYFLMHPKGEPGASDQEIASIRWVEPGLAADLISQSTKASARKRDLEVLAAAMTRCRNLQ